MEVQRNIRMSTRRSVAHKKAIESETGSVLSHQIDHLRIECLQIKQPRNPFLTFNLWNFLRKLNISLYLELENEDEQNVFLKEINALHLFKACQDLDEELSIKRVESFYLKEHIKDTEPKLLNRLKDRKVPRLPFVEHDSFDMSRGESVTSQNVSLLRKSGFPFGSSKRKIEFRINEKVKISMIEKATLKMERFIKSMEKQANIDYLESSSHVEELTITRSEVNGTLNNFKLHFMQDPADIKILLRGSERELAMKFRTYVYKYLNAGRTLLSRIRLTDSSITQNIKTFQEEYRHKADLSHYLGEIDFEQLFIKKQQLSIILEDKSGQLAGIKKIAATAQLGMADQKRNLDKNKNNLNLLRRKNSELTDTVDNLEKIANTAKTANEKLELELKDMNAKLEKYKAPSVAEYIELKKELHNLEKEEKILIRKMNLINMKLQSTLARYKIILEKIDQKNKIRKEAKDKKIVENEDFSEF